MCFQYPLRFLKKVFFHSLRFIYKNPKIIRSRISPGSKSWIKRNFWSEDSGSRFYSDQNQRSRFLYRSKSRDHSVFWSNSKNCKWQDHGIINYDPDFLIHIESSTKSEIPRSVDHRLKWILNCENSYWFRFLLRYKISPKTNKQEQEN